MNACLASLTPPSAGMSSSGDDTLSSSTDKSPIGAGDAKYGDPEPISGVSSNPWGMVHPPAPADLASLLRWEEASRQHPAVDASAGLPFRQQRGVAETPSIDPRFFEESPVAGPFFPNPALVQQSPAPDALSIDLASVQQVEAQVEQLAKFDWTNPSMEFPVVTPGPTPGSASEPADNTPAEAASDSAADNSPLGESSPVDVSFEEVQRLASVGYKGELRFDTVDQARQSSVRRAEVQHDPTLPVTMEQKRVHVLLLVRAVKDVSSSGDSSRTLADFGKGKWSSETIEVTCWEVLVSVELDFDFF
ncbi:hypothetical protein N7512_001978 [Penicillium capsulatum]|nr:hypothetical protein N7512_001978 [Penicillium capsulatum]